METMQLMSPEEPLSTEEEPMDELEELSSSVRTLMDAGGEEPKLQYLMMDQSFSMMTLQNQNSAITWETTYAHTPVQLHSQTRAMQTAHGHTLAPAAAGKILFIMDEELMSRRKRKKKEKIFTEVSPEILAEADRPAMVEVSLPNPSVSEGANERGEQAGEEKLFTLLSEGSEILNIIAPPDISMTDEEESSALEDQLFYLEERKPSEKIVEELEEEFVQETLAKALIPEACVEEALFSPPQHRGGTTAGEDYFEKFTLLDSQAPAGTDAGEPQQEVREEIPEEHEDEKVQTSVQELATGISSSVSLLDLSGEHLDDVFYGEIPPEASVSAVDSRRVSFRSSLKHSGESLFSREESILTPIFLPERSERVIDLNLLEEPKALAFHYSDLYSEAMGCRRDPEQQEEQQEDTGSEKSFHSQQSDREDRGYLEKFELRVEASRVECDVKAEEHPREHARFTAFPQLCEDKGEVEEEITDFFRDSASSSPYELFEENKEEEKEEEELIRVPRVSFKEEKAPQMEEQELDEEEFLPVELSEECPAWEESLPRVRTAPKEEKRKEMAAPEVPEQISEPEVKRGVQRKTKPFLELSALTPMKEQEEQTHAGDTLSEGSAGVEGVKDLSSEDLQKKPE